MRVTQTFNKLANAFNGTSPTTLKEGECLSDMKDICGHTYAATLKYRMIKNEVDLRGMPLNPDPLNPHCSEYIQ